MASEQFSLCWDNFHKNMSSGMNSLLENEDLVDVTLAVQGKCLKAHKMVLSVCSPYFKELFKSNPCQHPIVFMKDVSYEALSDLLQFMYQGEVQVSQENLTTFIKTAEALQIKGLTGDGNGTTEPEPETAQEHPVHHVEGYKPTPRPKKTAPAPIATSPQVKRQRLSVSSTESQPLPPSITKTEPAPTPSTGTSEAPVQFKMEPYDQSQNLVDETGDDNFGDDTLDDNTVDDSEDYSMMEGGVGEEEPQAGTSTDGAGEGQGYLNVQNFTQIKDLKTMIHKQERLIGVFKSEFLKQRCKYDQLFGLLKEIQNSGVVHVPLNNEEPSMTQLETEKYSLPLTTVDEVRGFNQEIVNKDYRDYLIKTYSSVGGTDGNEEGKVVIKKLRGIFFTEHVLTLFSWTGVSRSAGVVKKEAFQLCENILNLFYDIVKLADSRWTTTKNENFFKINTLKHAKQNEKAAEIKNKKKQKKNEHVKVEIPEEPGNCSDDRDEIF